MEFIKNNEALVTKKIYSYLDVKKMTNKFIDKLGQGDYGFVYSGRLLDVETTNFLLKIKKKLIL